MMEKMIALQQKRRSKKGGFTLVELIVVLVILAILAALLIPALTGYIDKAKQKRIVAETRQCVMAAQTLLDEDYGAGNNTGALLLAQKKANRKSQFAFGPFLCIGIAIAMFFGETIADWYMGLL